MTKIYLCGITTTHQLAKELMAKPDNFLAVEIDDREYSIKGIKNKRTHANVDDGVLHTTLLCEKLDGNIVR